jgi:hypothetical protein
VNFGGWLLWEPGPANKSPLVQSLGDDCIPKDEWTLCEQLVEKHGSETAQNLMYQHRKSHVSKADFIAIKSLGFNAVRVPFVYWAFSPRAGEPFIGNCTEFLDAALDWGSEVGLSVVLCLHAGVGFQSSEPPCGCANENWHPRNFDVAATVDIMRHLGKRYGCHTALGGICILNEPHGDLPALKLNRYFREAYHTLRNECGLPLRVQIMMPVFHHDFKDFRGKYTEDNGYRNVVFDVHMYQVFGDPYAGWRKMSLAQHLRYATAARTKEHDAKCIADEGERVVVSEFSLAMPVWHDNFMISREHAALSNAEKSLLRRCFAFRQLRTFARLTEGCFFWSWKDDAGPEWSLVQCREKCWMPRVSDSIEYDRNGTATAWESQTDLHKDRRLPSPKRESTSSLADSVSAEHAFKRQKTRDSDDSTDVGQSSDYESEEQLDRDSNHSSSVSD